MRNTLQQSFIQRTTLAVACVLAFPFGGAAQATDEVVYYHADAIGSIRMITGASQEVVARYDYLPFGELWGTEPPVSNSVRFVGKERDGETGYDYFGARHLASGIGRFTTVFAGADSLITSAVTAPKRVAIPLEFIVRRPMRSIAFLLFRLAANELGFRLSRPCSMRRPWS